MTPTRSEQLEARATTLVQMCRRLLKSTDALLETLDETELTSQVDADMSDVQTAFQDVEVARSLAVPAAPPSKPQACATCSKVPLWLPSDALEAADGFLQSYAEAGRSWPGMKAEARHLAMHIKRMFEAVPSPSGPVGSELESACAFLDEQDRKHVDLDEERWAAWPLRARILSTAQRLGWKPGGAA